MWFWLFLWIIQLKAFIFKVTIEWQNKYDTDHYCCYVICTLDFYIPYGQHLPNFHVFFGTFKVSVIKCNTTKLAIHQFRKSNISEVNILNPILRIPRILCIGCNKRRKRQRTASYGRIAMLVMIHSNFECAAVSFYSEC